VVKTVRLAQNFIFSDIEIDIASEGFYL